MYSLKKSFKKMQCKFSIYYIFLITVCLWFINTHGGWISFLGNILLFSNIAMLSAFIINTVMSGDDIFDNRVVLKESEIYCSICDATKQVLIVETVYGFPSELYKPCSNCNGTGKLDWIQAITKNPKWRA